MTTVREGRSGAVASAGVVSYLRHGEALAVTPAGTDLGAMPVDIPERELTPRVRDAILKLVSDTQILRHELQLTRSRLESAERAADQDQLLPVLNRRAFVRELTRHIAFSARYAVPASLLYFDLDGFKRINDTYGHAGGDAVLAHFAETLTRHVRQSDAVGRLGGDEFGVVLVYAGHEQADRKAQRLIETLSARPAVFNGQALPVGVSYGAFELRAEEDAESTLVRADSAMYSRKRASR